MEWNYLSDKEAEMTPREVDLQIVLALQTCEHKADVMALLQDVRQHERLQVLNILQKTILKPNQDEIETLF
jgi:hypothetical protein